ncbi:hypothetical protein CMV_027891 [Castanea mollissima]|uniref:Uncharacterized protein n=1 Tax=Castanea mollissima TaxID=60419 RepID=A0A8J4QH57_9ROSI|nr:hypothetical protein CMV_027891 [Castanea mollissima]
MRSEDSGANHLKKVKPTSQVPNPTLYAIATDFASLQLDSSALDRLSSPSSNHASPPVHSQFSIPHPPPLCSDHSTLLPIQISEALNKFKNSQLDETLELDSIELSKEEASLVESLYPRGLFGVSALLDHESAALSAVSNAVTALSCEAIKADVWWCSIRWILGMGSR